MQDMIRSKWFWLAAAFIVPFVVIWISASLVHAIVAYAVFGGMFFFFKTQMSQKRDKQETTEVHLHFGGDNEGSVTPRERRPKRENKIIRKERETQRRIRRRGL